MFPEDTYPENQPVNETPAQESQSEQPEPVQPKQSPYANSPYTAANRTGNAGYQQPNYQAYQPSYQSYQQPSKPPKAPRQRSGKGWKTALCIVLALAVLAVGCGATAAFVSERADAQMTGLREELAQLRTQVDTRPNQSAGTMLTVPAEGLTPAQVYQQNVASVVTVSCTVRTTSFGRTAEGTSRGSGFILSEDGYVVTNYHVVENATAISVILNNGDSLTATLIGKDSANDVAVLKAEGEGLQCVTLGSSEELTIGDMVVAIGNPLGTLNATQTVGYVSGKNREVTTDNTIISMIQTDAAINPGNSGGPLFNMRGEVVGITTAKYSGTTNSGASIEGIGFAIPIDDVLSIIGDLRDLGYVTGAYLGVTVTNTDAQSAEYYGIPQGAYVQSVVKGMAADEAGIQPKDIIIQLGEYEVSNMNDLTRALRKFKAGDETVVTVFRGGQQIELPITLSEKPQETVPENTEEMPQDGSYDEWYEYFRRYFGQP